VRLCGRVVGLAWVGVLGLVCAWQPAAVRGQEGVPQGPRAPETKTPAAQSPALPDAPEPVQAPDCGQKPCPAAVDWFTRFMNGPEVQPLTAKEKGRLAVTNLLDPFNALTILGEAGISTAANAHSPYGPGMRGFGRNVGVSLTEDMTGEFFNTFLIPSLAHQDPHYHRLPKASLVRRVLHTVTQVVWTRGDNGRGMVNYATLLGNAIDDEIGDLYVPGRQTNLAASATRYGVGLASSPVDNLITEFLPDVAKHIHLRVVILQRIVNQVAKTDGAP